MLIKDIHAENNAINIIPKVASPLVFVQELMNIMMEIRWWIFLAFILVIADLWFGIRVSQMKGIKVRYSSAGRRTLNKFVDYFLYILIGTSLGMSLCQSFPDIAINPVIISSVVLGFCYAFEVDSIYDHICYLKGKKKVISIWKAMWLIITFRFGELRDIDNLKPVEEVETLNPKINE